MTTTRRRVGTIKCMDAIRCEKLIIRDGHAVADEDLSFEVPSSTVYRRGALLDGSTFYGCLSGRANLSGSSSLENSPIVIERSREFTPNIALLCRSRKSRSSLV